MLEDAWKQTNEIFSSHGQEEKRDIPPEKGEITKKITVVWPLRR